MINVTLRIGGIGGMNRVACSQYSLSDGTTLQEFMQTLVAQHGDEVLHTANLVAVNGQAIREPAQSRIVLQDGSVVAVIRALAGG
jgi:molybdopterin converting factor small subunit